MSDTQEIKVTGGVGAFFYGAIPAILGFAALAWLAFATGIVEFHHSQVAYNKRQTYEGRRDARVGVNGKLLAPVDLVYNSRGCIKIDRAFLDGQNLTTYVVNNCREDREYVKYTIREIAPDGTTIHGQEPYIDSSSSSTILTGEKMEIHADTSDDPRTVKIVVTMGMGQE